MDLFYRNLAFWNGQDMDAGIVVREKLDQIAKPFGANFVVRVIKKQNDQYLFLFFNII
ncbi:hypothetical protein [uncultured Desulfosarcina sp.]|uniref:hypothetical protein n=1 Tax=uncultured Desulfosarcina sp. TaxID=218289 RepID=UPI0029C6295C|nr:hypothetical protein [uncultured Desulfosarcina sp.]